MNGNFLVTVTNELTLFSDRVKASITDKLACLFHRRHQDLAPIRDDTLSLAHLSTIQVCVLTVLRFGTAVVSRRGGEMVPTVLGTGKSLGLHMARWQHESLGSGTVVQPGGMKYMLLHLFARRKHQFKSVQ